MGALLSKLWNNKTTVLNVLAVAAGCLGFLAGHEVIAQNPEIAAVLVSVLGGVNVVIRFLGGKPIEVKKAE